MGVKKYRVYKKIYHKIDFGKIGADLAIKMNDYGIQIFDDNWLDNCYKIVISRDTIDEKEAEKAAEEIITAIKPTIKIS